MDAQQLLYFSVSRHNILPLTSRCGVSCVFCSHRYNPPGVQAVFFGELDMFTVEDLLDLLDSGKKIVIGESATRLCEGEPFHHPRFGEIMDRVRRKFPRTPIQITTNGDGLTEEILEKLAQLGGIELIVSLNSADPESRLELMGKHPARETLEYIARLKDYSIPWHASLVLLPHITGWGDVEEGIKFAQENGAQTMRLLLPGFSRLAKVDWDELAEIPQEAKERVKGYRERYSMPITLEPALVTDLNPVVSGVMADSPAAGKLQVGDVIESVDGEKPFSRVDAFYLVQRAENPKLVVKRDGKVLTIKLTKKAKASSGLVMDRDLDPGDLERALEMAGDAKRVLLLTSRWAAPLWELVVPEGWRVVGVKSQFFGGNIAAAGLLTVADYRVVLEGLDLEDFDAILLPPISFDQRGIDLASEDVRDLAKNLTVSLIWSV